MKQDIDKCKHKWIVLTPDQRNGPGVSVCEKCNLQLYHSSRLQLDINKYAFGFQKWVAIGSMIISVLALLVAFAAYIKKNSNENFVPLTQTQFNAEENAGFSYDQIVKFEQVRKSN